MVKVHLHVGMHRSGTSSVQFLLRRLFGSDVARGNWYPVGSALGASNGHEGLARFFDARYGKQNSDAGLRELASIREQALRCDSLIISSENFSYAKDSDLEKICEIFKSDDLHLIFTASPLIRRAISLWTAQIQFGSVSDIEAARASIVSNQIFDPNYVNRMVEAFEPNLATLIVTDPKKEPESLLKSFFDACDLPFSKSDLTKQDVAKKNQSPGLWEMAMLRQFNIVFNQARKMQGEKTAKNASYHQARQKLQAVFRTVEWTEAIPHMSILLPSSYVGPLSEIGRETRARILKLVEENKLSVDGDIDILFEGLDLN